MSFVETSCWLATYDPVRLMVPSMPWPKVGIIFRGDSGFCQWWMLSWCERHAVGYIVGIAKIKRLNAMTAQRQREAQDFYAAFGTNALWFTEIHYAAGNWDRKRRIIANINNGLTSGKSPIADMGSINSYFLNVLKVAVQGPDTDRQLSTRNESTVF